MKKFFKDICEGVFYMCEAFQGGTNIMSCREYILPVLNSIYSLVEFDLEMNGKKIIARPQTC